MLWKGASASIRGGLDVDSEKQGVLKILYAYMAKKKKNISFP